MCVCVSGYLAQVAVLKSVQPQTGSLFVRLFLGRVNVRVQSKKDQEKLRDEFNKFKDRTNGGVPPCACSVVCCTCARGVVECVRVRS